MLIGDVHKAVVYKNIANQLSDNNLSRYYNSRHDIRAISVNNCMTDIHLSLLLTVFLKSIIFSSFI